MHDRPCPPRAAARADGGDHASRARQSGCASPSTSSGGTATTSPGPRRRPPSCPASRAGARRRDLGNASSEPGLAGERRLPAVHELDDAGVDVAADDLVPGVRDLRRERQPDLPERDDDASHDPHQEPHGLAGLALSSTASASARSPALPRASRRPRPVTAPPSRARLELGPSGSGRASAKRVMSPSVTPRSGCELRRRRVACRCGTASGRRSACRRRICGTRQAHRGRIFVGDIQSTMQLNVTPPATLGRWSCRKMALKAGVSKATVQRLWECPDFCVRGAVSHRFEPSAR